MVEGWFTWCVSCWEGRGGGFKDTSRTLNDGLEKFMVSFNRGLIVYVNCVVRRVIN